MYAFSADGLCFVTLDLFDSACQAASLAPGILGALAVASKESGKAVFARVVVLELTADSSANTRDDVAARLQVRLVVLVSASKRVEVRTGLRIVERKLQLGGMAFGVCGGVAIAGGVFTGVGHAATWNEYRSRRRWSASSRTLGKLSGRQRIRVQCRRKRRVDETLVSVGIQVAWGCRYPNGMFYA